MIAVSDVTAWDSTADATKAALAIAAVSKQIEGKNCLGYSLKYAAQTERVSSRGGQYLVLNRYPLVEVTEVTVDGDVLEDWEQYDNGDRWGWLYREDGWPACLGTVRLTNDSQVAGNGILKVTYGAGYAIEGQTPGSSGVPAEVELLPADIKMAIVDLTLLRLGKRLTEFSGKQVLQQSLGAMRVQYAEARQYSSASRMEAQVLADIRENHRRPQLP